jgi:hypothetical protein
MSEVEISGNTYLIRRMSARDQLPIVLRLLRASKMTGADDATFMDMLAVMSDQEARHLMDHCLGAVSRKQGSAWAPIQANGSGGSYMFDDIENDLMLQFELVAAVLEANVKNFSRAAPPSSPSGTTPPA